MQQSKTLSHLKMIDPTALICLGIVLLETPCMACPGTVNNRQKTIRYQTYSKEECKWVLGPSNIPSNIIVSIKFSIHESYSTCWGCKKGSAIGTLPNGTPLENENLSNDGTQRPWCGLYVKHNHGNETTCATGNELLTTCRNKPNTTASLNWPPIIMSTAQNMDIKLEYEVYKCDGNLIFPATTAAATTSTTIATTEKNEHKQTTPSVGDHANTTTKASQLDGNSTDKFALDKETANSENAFHPSSIVAIVLALLLLATLVVIGFLVFKRNEHKQQPHTQTPVGNLISANHNAGGNLEETINPYTMAEAGNGIRSSSEVYENDSGEIKQTVYNELYHMS